VFRARDHSLDRDVALKVFRPGSGRTSAGALAEARSVAMLNHPNVCMVFGVDETLGYPIIAMEFAPGRPLSAVLAGAAIAPGRVAGIGRQVAAGLAAAHAQGVTHGDLKPENVMVSDSDAVKILDFGLARRRAAAGVAPDVTVALGPADAADTGGLFGTPNYFAPEQAQGRPATEASDVYALGLMLHEMLTGRRAFAGADLLATLEKVRTADPRGLADEVPPPFDAVLRRALEPEPAQRTLTMADIARQLAMVVPESR
jgi:serine/threonine-protein kinase